MGQAACFKMGCQAHFKTGQTKFTLIRLAHFTCSPFYMQPILKQAEFQIGL